MRVAIILCLVAFACAHLSVKDAKNKVQSIWNHNAETAFGEEILSKVHKAEAVAKNAAHKATEAAKAAAAKIKGLFAANMMNVEETIIKVDKAIKKAGSIATTVISTANTAETIVTQLIQEVQVAQNQVQRFLNVTGLGNAQINLFLTQATKYEDMVESYIQRAQAAQNKAQNFINQAEYNETQIVANIETLEKDLQKLVDLNKAAHAKIHNFVAKEANTPLGQALIKKTQQFKAAVDSSAHKVGQAVINVFRKFKALFHRHQAAKVNSGEEVVRKTLASRIKGLFGHSQLNLVWADKIRAEAKKAFAKARAQNAEQAF